KNLLANFPVAPDPGNLGTVAVTANGVTNNIPIGDLIIISPNFQREHDVQFNSDYTWGKHQFGARFLLNQEKFILPVNSTQAQFNQDEPIHNRKVALNDVWTINSRLVNDLRLQYSFFSLATVNSSTTNRATAWDGRSVTRGREVSWEHRVPFMCLARMTSNCRPA